MKTEVFWGHISQAYMNTHVNQGQYTDEDPSLPRKNSKNGSRENLY